MEFLAILSAINQEVMTKMVLLIATKSDNNEKDDAGFQKMIQKADHKS